MVDLSSNDKSIVLEFLRGTDIQFSTRASGMLYEAQANQVVPANTTTLNEYTKVISDPLNVVDIDNNRFVLNEDGQYFVIKNTTWVGSENGVRDDILDDGVLVNGVISDAGNFEKYERLDDGILTKTVVTKVFVLEDGDVLEPALINENNQDALGGTGGFITFDANSVYLVRLG